jgi:hypothetical protein
VAGYYGTYTYMGRGWGSGTRLIFPAFFFLNQALVIEQNEGESPILDWIKQGKGDRQGGQARGGEGNSGKFGNATGISLQHSPPNLPPPAFSQPPPRLPEIPEMIVSAFLFQGPVLGRTPAHGHMVYISFNLKVLIRLPVVLAPKV